MSRSLASLGYIRDLQKNKTSKQKTSKQNGARELVESLPKSKKPSVPSRHGVSTGRPFQHSGNGIGGGGIVNSRSSFVTQRF